jgi:septum formation protein
MVLASRSPARRQLLEESGIEVIVRPTDCDESCIETDPNRAVATLARRKLDAFLAADPHCRLPVLCCDTLVWFEGALVGKARDRSEAFIQLSRFSGKAQTVHSGWALRYGERIVGGFDETTVYFRHLDRATIESYLDTGEWNGAAGSYRIQGAGRALVERIEGNADTIIGLPISRISEILSATVPASDGAESPPPRG